MRFAGTFRWAQTSYFWRVIYVCTCRYLFNTKCSWSAPLIHDSPYYWVRSYNTTVMYSSKYLHMYRMIHIEPHKSKWSQNVWKKTESSDWALCVMAYFNFWPKHFSWFQCVYLVFNFCSSGQAVNKMTHYGASQKRH